MVFNELLAVGIAHAAKGVILTFELTVERLEGFAQILFYGLSLFTGDSWSERVVSQVTANSDACRFDHLGILCRERRAIKFAEVHVTLVSSDLPFVVVFDDTVEELGECHVRIGTSRIHTDT